MEEQKIELLAPVGGMEQLKAAVRFGADAVYGGMQSYGLRAYAGNFDMEQLKQAVAFCHSHGVLFYVTMNILPTDNDLPGFVEAAKGAAAAGVDAAIVSDIGAMSLLHREVPELPIHVSTQANVLNSATAIHLQQTLGVTRVVLSRELSLADIKAMRDKLPETLEIETFVHGAMCVAYSGRCLLSGALMGRSGNRGACAQPCRWKYYLMEEKRPGMYLPVCEDDRGTYLYSSYDLCMLPYLPELLEAGIVSLKIEGRMKTAYYVACVVSVYRRGLNLLKNQGKETFRAAVPELMEELNKASHRVSNTGFYFGAPVPTAGAEGFQQTALYVGDVAQDATENSPALVMVKNRIGVGDTLELLTPQGSFAFEVEEITLEETGEKVELATVAGTMIRLKLPAAAEQGDLLRKPYAAQGTAREADSAPMKQTKERPSVGLAVRSGS